MITEVILPKLGQTMEEGSVVEWVKKEGDPIKRGDLLFTVESDKAVLDVEATARGFLRKILVPEGQDGAGTDPGGPHHPRGRRGYLVLWGRGSGSYNGRSRRRRTCR